ncbi:MAG: PilC/PilY family type IV pilus protein, partial [Desulfobacterales bacterium]
MKINRYYGFAALFVLICLVLRVYPVVADDTCVFSVTADDLPPNIVLLLDSGAEMEQIVWHSKFNNNFDYTPVVDTEKEALGDPISGNGFFIDEGYAVKYSGNKYYLVEIPTSLDVAKSTKELPAVTSDTLNKKGTWTIKGKTLTLPALPSTVAVDGVIDNANYFRYSKNYLNWLFFATGSGSYYEDDNVSSVHDGTDLPDKSRFYYAKKAIMTVAKDTGFKAKFGIYYFANTSGGSQAQPLKFVVDAGGLTSAFINNINNMKTVTYSPLAEGLSTVGYYYSSPSSGASGGYCQSNFTIVISPGVSSEDKGTTSQHVPASLSDYDGDGADGGIGEGKVMENTTLYTIPVNQNGSTWLDDVAYYLYSHDVVGDAPSTGSLCYDARTVEFQVGETVTGGSSSATGVVTAVNVHTDSPSGCLELSNLAGFFTNDEILTGSNGGSATVNGTLFTSGEGFQNIITYTIGFMGDKEGDLFLINTSNNGNGHKNLYDTSDEEYGKYHFTADDPAELSAQLLAAVNSIISRTSTFMAPVVPVTRTTSGDKIYMAFFKPSEGNFWEGNVTKYGISEENQIVDRYGNPATWPNGAMIDTAIPYWATIDWADPSKSNYIANQFRNIYTYLNGNVTSFDSGNSNLTPTVLGNPTRTPAEIINYVRGADILDEDGDGNTTENRFVITGDVLHSEPAIFQYRYTSDSSRTVVYFGSNDGMLHAVFDEETPSSGSTPGTEMWAFIPPDQLPRLKDMVEGIGHQYYVDSTPKIYFKDINGNGLVESGDKVILVCGERKGGTGYFALDVTVPTSPPIFLWALNQSDIPELGETWSEPQFGVVKTSVGDTTGTPVFFVGGGYHETNSKGKTVLAINVETGNIVRQFVTGMDYAIPSSVLVVDEDGNGFVDKVYVGDLGGQMWR